MRKLLMIVWSCFSFLYASAQQKVTVYHHNGSKTIGELMQRDSVAQKILVKIQGGSEFVIPFSEIDSVVFSTPKQKLVLEARPVWGFGLGALMNADRNILQFDAQAGFRFNAKMQGGIGVAFSDVISGYLDYRYYFYQSKLFSVGAYVQPGVVLSQFRNNYYYDTYNIRGFYSNTGFSLKLFNNTNRSFSIHAGYQYVNKKQSYTDYLGNQVKIVSDLNRYVIQGIFAF